MKKPFAIGALVGVAVLTGTILWRASDTYSTSAALVPAETSAAAIGLPQGSENSSASRTVPAASIPSTQGMPASVASQADPEGTALESEEPEASNGEPTAADPEPVAAPEPAPVGSGPPSLSPPSAPRPQQIPPLPAQGIFHGQAEYLVTAPGQEQRPAIQAEFWIDLETGDARMSEKDGSGSNEVISIRRGTNQTVMFPGDKRAQTQVSSDGQAPQRNEIRDRVLGYRLALDQGAFVVLGEDVLNGQPVIRVRPQGPGPDLADIFLSRDQGLPVKEVTYRPSQSGGREEVQTRVVSYRLVETVTRAQVAADLFSPTIPSDWESVTTRTLDLAGAGAFRLFDLYWLGTEHSGMSLTRIFHDERVQSSGRINVVVLDYAQPVTDSQSTTAPNQLRVVLGPALSAEEQAARNRGGPPPGAEAVTIHGRRGTLFVPQAPQGGSSSPQDVAAAQTPPAVLELPMERSLVVIYGRDRNQITQAAQNLQKLN